MTQLTNFSSESTKLEDATSYDASFSRVAKTLNVSVLTSKVFRLERMTKPDVCDVVTLFVVFLFLQHWLTTVTCYNDIAGVSLGHGNKLEHAWLFGKIMVRQPPTPIIDSDIISYFQSSIPPDVVSSFLSPSFNVRSFWSSRSCHRRRNRHWRDVRARASSKRC